MAPAKNRKIAIVGSRSVGKSSLTVQYCEGHFVESYYPTVENSFSKEIVWKTQKFSTEIVDTQGQDEYSMMSSKNLIGVHGYMVVYSVGSRASFEMVTIIRDKILNALGLETTPIMIVGNKADMKGSARQVTLEEGQKLAQGLKAGFTESSARENLNVGKAFESMIAEIEHANNPEKEPQKSNCCVM